MNLLKGPTLITCTQCNQRIINYPNQLCRRQFLPPSQRTCSVVNKFENKSGNLKLDEFIRETQLNSEFCDDFIEWIPHSNIKNIKFLTNGGNSKVYCGTWSLLLTMPLTSKQLSTKIALKVIRDSDNDCILNEVKKLQIKKIFDFFWN